MDDPRSSSVRPILVAVLVCCTTCTSVSIFNYAFRSSTCCNCSICSWCCSGLHSQSQNVFAVPRIYQRFIFLANGSEKSNLPAGFVQYFCTTEAHKLGTCFAGSLLGRLLGSITERTRVFLSTAKVDKRKPGSNISIPLA